MTSDNVALPRPPLGEAEDAGLDPLIPGRDRGLAEAMKLCVAE